VTPGDYDTLSDSWICVVWPCRYSDTRVRIVSLRIMSASPTRTCNRESDMILNLTD